MNSKEYKTAFKNFLFFNLYDKNLYNEKYKNPHEIYEDQLISKPKNIDDEDEIENKKMNDDVNKNNNDKNVNNIEDKNKSANQPLKIKFNHLSVFNRDNYNFFEKSQNMPNINKYLKNDL